MFINNTANQIHRSLSRFFCREQKDVDSPTVDELARTIIETQYLWDLFRSELKKDNIVTNVATKEYLNIFLEENRELVEKYYFILKSNRKDDSTTSSINKTNINASCYLEKVKNALINESNSLFHRILLSCKDEVISTEDALLYTSPKTAHSV